MNEQRCNPCLVPGWDVMAAALGCPARAAGGEWALAKGDSVEGLQRGPGTGCKSQPSHSHKT